MIEVFQGIKVKKDPANTTTIKYGDNGDVFYIILNGEAACWVPVDIKVAHKVTEGFIDQLRKGGNAFDFSYRDVKTDKTIDFDTFIDQNPEIFT